MSILIDQNRERAPEAPSLRDLGIERPSADFAERAVPSERQPSSTANSNFNSYQDRASSHLLDEIATAKLHPSLAGLRQEILESLRHDIAPPENVHQGVHTTCTIGSSQFLMCKTRPAEYLRLMHSLLTKGEATLANGDTIKLDPAAIDADSIPLQESFTARRITERLFQTSLMQYAVGDKIHYDCRTDTSTGTHDTYGHLSFQGLCKDQYERALQGLFGQGFGRYDTDKIGTDAVIEKIKQNNASMGGTLTEVAWDEFGDHQLHAIVITKISGDSFTYYNPLRPSELKTENMSWLRTNLKCAMIADGSAVGEITDPPPVLAAKPGKNVEGTSVQIIHARPSDPVKLKEMPLEEIPRREGQIDFNRAEQAPERDKGTVATGEPGARAKVLPKAARHFVKSTDDDDDIVI